MEPIVYIYQDHLQDFWNSGQSQCFGAAFEWKGEQVYHVYIKYPQVAPTGYSMPCLFRVVDTDDYEKAEDVALSVYAFACRKRQNEFRSLLFAFMSKTRKSALVLLLSMTEESSKQL